MEAIRRNQFDTADEQVKVINKVIDNQNQIEGKLLQMIAAQGATDTYNEAVEEHNSEIL